MRPELEKLIRKHYTRKVYVNLRDTKVPLENSRWGKKVSVKLVDRLKKQVDAQLLYASDEDYDVSELIKFFDGRIFLRVSFIGPYGYMSLKGMKGEDREEYRKKVTKIKKVLKEFNIELLSAEEIIEPVAWLETGDSLVGDFVKVWNCLFCEY